jgi:hypothetical protein
VFFLFVERYQPNFAEPLVRTVVLRKAPDTIESVLYD